MITSDVLKARADEVSHLIKWWSVQSSKRYNHIRSRGSQSDFVNDVWQSLLSNFHDGKSVDCTLSTVVTNHCQWVLYRHFSFHAKRTTKFDFEYYHWYRSRRIRHDDRICTDQELIDHVFLTELESAIILCLITLTRRESAVLRARFGLFGDKEMTLEQVGKTLNRSRERVRQIESKALKKLQHHSRLMYLLPFVDQLTRKRELEQIEEPEQQDQPDLDTELPL